MINPRVYVAEVYQSIQWSESTSLMYLILCRLPLESCTAYKHMLVCCLYHVWKRQTSNYAVDDCKDIWENTYKITKHHHPEHVCFFLVLFSTLWGWCAELYYAAHMSTLPALPLCIGWWPSITIVRESESCVFNYKHMNKKKITNQLTVLGKELLWQGLKLKSVSKEIFSNKSNTQLNTTHKHRMRNMLNKSLTDLAWAGIHCWKLNNFYLRQNCPNYIHICVDTDTIHCVTWVCLFSENTRDNGVNTMHVTDMGSNPKWESC